MGIAGSPQKRPGCATSVVSMRPSITRPRDVALRLGDLCPDGIDVVFENVGGSTLDRVVAAPYRATWCTDPALCGTISNYNEVEGAEPLHWYMNFVSKRARMEGFLVLDYLDRFRKR